MNTSKKNTTGLVAIVFSALTTLAQAGNVYYASPNGTSAGAGTTESPYDIVTAVSKLGDNTRDEVKLLPGTYKVGGFKLANIDYMAKMTGAGESASDVVLDGEGSGATVNAYYGGEIRNVTFTNYAGVLPLSLLNANGCGDVVVSNCVFTQISGGVNACKTSGAGNILLVDCVFTDNATSDTYGFINCGNKGTRFLRCLFANSSFTGWSVIGGGALYSSSGCTIDTCTISNNTATANGGGISLWGNAFVTNTTFIANSSSANGGGAAYSNPGTGTTNTFVDCKFIQNCNTANGISGGAVRFSGLGYSILRKCVFTGNYVSGQNGYGGAIYGTGDGAALIQDCTFTNNLGSGVNGMGGACHFECYGAGTRIDHCTFVSNYAAFCGGAICSRGPSEIGQYIRLSVVNSTFEGNSAVTFGGAFGEDYDGNARIGLVGGFTNCVFRKNFAQQGGAANGVGLTFSGCEFTENRTDAMGGTASEAGAILVNSRGMNRACNPECTNHLRIVSCVFKDNAATSYCGALYGCVDTNYEITDSVFEGNHGGAGWGGAVGFNASVKQLAVDRSVFTRNYGKCEGGAIGICYTSPQLVSGTIRNCLFAANTNTANYAGALSLVKNCQVDNCTFYKNVSTGQGGAIYSSTSDGTTLRNCLFYGNRLTWRTTGATCDIWAEDVRLNTATNCCSNLAGNFPAEHGNLDVTDPMFVDEDAGDFRLAEGSPCINAGANEPWMVGARDLQNSRKVPRIIGSAVDIGCYEFRPTPGMMMIVR